MACKNKVRGGEPGGCSVKPYHVHEIELTIFVDHLLTLRPIVTSSTRCPRSEGHCESVNCLVRKFDPQWISSDVLLPHPFTRIQSRNLCSWIMHASLAECLGAVKWFMKCLAPRVKIAYFIPEHGLIACVTVSANKHGFRNHLPRRAPIPWPRLYLRHSLGQQ